MAKSYLTPNELVLGNKWLKTVFFPCVRTGTSAYVVSRYRVDDVANACKVIYQALLDRLFDKNGDLNVHFETLAYSSYFNIIGDDTSTYDFKKEFIAKVFANVCARQEIFWDDRSYTPFEQEYFKKTIFGKALWDFECFVSQEPAPIKTPKVTTSNTTTNTTPKAPRPASAGAGHTLYRNNAGGIVGTSKEILSVPFVYYITGDFNPKGKTSPRIHVSPQNQTAPLKVKYTSGQGFNDCVLYFESAAKADDFKTQCDANLPSNVAVLKVKKMSTDPNGYVEVNTQYGPAYIKASKLHEEIVEDEVVETELVESTEVDLMEDIMAEINSKPAVSYKEAAAALAELLK